MKRPWTPLHASVHQTLRDRQLLPQRSKILIALSGGQDSLCLTQLLLDLQPLWHWQLGIVHCDHQWRSDSTDNAAHVRQLAHTWNLPYHEAIADTDVSTEAKARNWRYKVFTTIATEQNCQQVVTGHTRSDRAETLLYNLVRGSGTTGLQSLKWRRSLSSILEVIRPLLEISRQQTSDFCESRSLPVWLDHTNDDLKFDRNRIRHTILPLLTETLNPQAELHLAQTAEILRAEVDYLQTQLEAVYDTVVQTEAGQSKLDRRQAAQLHPALQRRLMQKFCQDTKKINPTFSQVEALVRLFTAPNRSQSPTLSKGILRVDGNWLIWQGER
jgi:tRNA(Ile)-lysidine synthase